MATLCFLHVGGPCGRGGGTINRLELVRKVPSITALLRTGAGVAYCGLAEPGELFHWLEGLSNQRAASPPVRLSSQAVR
ncbi:hypothetical protein AAFF_G00307570 [Aldrovandia affinis]|uniref:Uncharacterized protein n=1 Tax=Aldrovandia affinis TaxID=143900 RepID=A0AAD7R8F2_9TELE|nr:hypothetical protein AAFF_G00307570 [Aldrovandia affinis]